MKALGLSKLLSLTKHGRHIKIQGARQRDFGSHIICGLEASEDNLIFDLWWVPPAHQKSKSMAQMPI